MSSQPDVVKLDYSDCTVCFDSLKSEVVPKSLLFVIQTTLLFHVLDLLKRTGSKESFVRTICL